MKKPCEGACGHRRRRRQPHHGAGRHGRHGRRDRAHLPGHYHHHQPALYSAHGASCCAALPRRRPPRRLGSTLAAGPTTLGPNALHGCRGRSWTWHRQQPQRQQQWRTASPRVAQAGCACVGLPSRPVPPPADGPRAQASVRRRSRELIKSTTFRSQPIMPTTQVWAARSRRQPWARPSRPGQTKGKYGTPRPGFPASRALAPGKKDTTNKKEKRKRKRGQCEIKKI